MWVFTRYGFYSIACADKPDSRPAPYVSHTRAEGSESVIVQSGQVRMDSASQVPFQMVIHNSC
jgi:hypothetical protein